LLLPADKRRKTVRSLRTILAIVALLLAGVCSEVRGDIIYDNTTTRIGTGLSFTQLELGSEVTAAGTDRFVTDLLIGVSQQGIAGTADMQARLYANDGSGGKPGTLLWASDLMQNVQLTGGIDLIDFSVPEVLVPDTFTWTIQISNTNPVGVGLPTFGPPTVGSSPTDWFGNSTIGWTQLASDPFMARVNAEPSAAVPEPSSVALLLPGLGVFLGRRLWPGRRGQSNTCIR
jgi:hypothetical protein